MRDVEGAVPYGVTMRLDKKEPAAWAAGSFEIRLAKR